MAAKKPNSKRNDSLRRNTAETLLWLLVILGLLVIVLQGFGYVELFVLQQKGAVIGLAVIAIALVAAAISSYVKGLKLREALKRLSQREKKRQVTLDSGGDDGVSGDAEDDGEDEVWKEKVKFSAVIEERQRLARELHDAVSQQLFAISMTATAVGRTMEKDWERAKRQVQLIEEMAAVAQSEMRALLLHLRPVHLDGKNLGQALQALIGELAQKVPMKITLEIDETIGLDPQAEDHLFRIAQEALSNTLRHSKADSMDIRLVRYGGQVRLTLRDNGIGFDPEEKKQASYGLLTMEERVHEIGGTFHLMSEPGRGTTIDIWVRADGTGRRDDYGIGE